MDQNNMSVQEQVEVDIAQAAIRSAFAEKYNELKSLKKEFQELEESIGANRLTQREEMKAKIKNILARGKSAENIAQSILVKGSGDSRKIREETKEAAKRINLQLGAEGLKVQDDLKTLEDAIGPSSLQRRNELQQRISDLEKELKGFQRQSESFCRMEKRSCVL